MATRKSMKLPIIITFIFICIIVYLFSNIKQAVVECEKVTTYDSSIKLTETVISNLDGKEIVSLNVTKKITIPDTYPKKEEALLAVKNSLEYTTEYLSNHASTIISENSVITEINVDDDELVLLDNLMLHDNNGEIVISIDTNTKSSDVIALKVGDDYTDGEFKMYLKNKGYSCK